jgi:hypothetical protein
MQRIMDHQGQREQRDAIRMRQRDALVVAQGLVAQSQRVQFQQLRERQLYRVAEMQRLAAGQQTIVVQNAKDQADRQVAMKRLNVISK